MGGRRSRPEETKDAFKNFYNFWTTHNQKDQKLMGKLMKEHLGIRINRIGSWEEPEEDVDLDALLEPRNDVNEGDDEDEAEDDNGGDSEEEEPAETEKEEEARIEGTKRKAEESLGGIEKKHRGGGGEDETEREGTEREGTEEAADIPSALGVEDQAARSPLPATAEAATTATATAEADTATATAEADTATADAAAAGGSPAISTPEQGRNLRYSRGFDSFASGADIPIFMDDESIQFNTSDDTEASNAADDTLSSGDRNNNPFADDFNLTIHEENVSELAVAVADVPVPARHLPHHLRKPFRLRKDVKFSDALAIDDKCSLEAYWRSAELDGEAALEHLAVEVVAERRKAGSGGAGTERGYPRAHDILLFLEKFGSPAAFKDIKYLLKRYRKNAFSGMQATISPSMVKASSDEERRVLVRFLFYWIRIDHRKQLRKSALADRLDELMDFTRLYSMFEGATQFVSGGGEEVEEDDDEDDEDGGAGGAGGMSVGRGIKSTGLDIVMERANIAAKDRKKLNSAIRFGARLGEMARRLGYSSFMLINPGFHNSFLRNLPAPDFERILQSLEQDERPRALLASAEMIAVAYSRQANEGKDDGTGLPIIKLETFEIEEEAEIPLDVFDTLD